MESSRCWLLGAGDHGTGPRVAWSASAALQRNILSICDCSLVPLARLVFQGQSGPEIDNPVRDSFAKARSLLNLIVKRVRVMDLTRMNVKDYWPLLGFHLYRILCRNELVRVPVCAYLCINGTSAHKADTVRN